MPEPDRKLSYKGGGRLHPEGGIFEVSLSVGLVGLKLDSAGGRYFPTTCLATIAARLTTFGVFNEIRFDWLEVSSVQRVQRWVPWDRGVRFTLRDRREFVFYSLSGETLTNVLDFAKANGATVEERT